MFFLKVYGQGNPPPPKKKKKHTHTHTHTLKSLTNLLKIWTERAILNLFWPKIKVNLQPDLDGGLVCAHKEGMVPGKDNAQRTIVLAPARANTAKLQFNFNLEIICF